MWKTIFGLQCEIRAGLSCDLMQRGYITGEMIVHGLREHPDNASALSSMTNYFVAFLNLSPGAFLYNPEFTLVARGVHHLRPWRGVDECRN